MKFTKMHGCGNDYLYVNGATEQIPDEEKPAMIRRVSDRHFGVGGDGVIFINPGKEGADFEMEMYNADGSRGEMCGNGIRCVAKYVYDHGMTDKTQLKIISAGAMKYLTLTVEDGKVQTVRVDMGAPILTPSEIPVRLKGAAAEKDSIVAQPIEILDRTFLMTCVSMGNPHAVVYLPADESLEDFPIEKYGPAFEHAPCFPRMVNTEFVHVDSRDHVTMRVWERGSGETLACGTGCCATAVASVLNGYTADRMTVQVRGGELQIEWDQEANTVFMTGPATTVFEGEV